MNVSLTAFLFACMYIKWSMSKGKDLKYTRNWISDTKDGQIYSEMGFKDGQPSFAKQDSWAEREYPYSRVIKTRNTERHEGMEDSVMKHVQFQDRELIKNSNVYKNSVDNFWAAMAASSNFLNIFKVKRQSNLSKLGTFPTSQVEEPYLTGTTWNINLKTYKVSAYASRFNDPYWKKQWYVQDYRTRQGPVMDLNVVPVYEKFKYTGKGVAVAIVDEGIARDHPDLAKNFDSSLSYDVCLDHRGSDPPKERKMKEAHGLKAAGVIGMAADNNICGVGIAYEAKIIGIRMLCKDANTGDTMARGLVHNLRHVDIYSNSWGPPDDPWKVCTLNHLTAEAYTRGVTKGRQGKGVIYTQCAGNGGDLGDNCATDCNINRPEVIGIGAADQFGKRCGFSERCTAVFTVTYSGGRFSGVPGSKEGVVAPMPNGGCTTYFTGTSAATPIASGIIALALQANSELTYRDVMHLIAMSSEVAPLASNRGVWYKNGRGFYVSNDFGFGLMNAENMVKLAKNWVNVPPKRTCTFTVREDPPRKFSKKEKAVIPFDTDACASSLSDSIQYLEHIEVASTVKFSVRGDIMIDIISPKGTRSTLLERRKRDKNTEGLRGLSIMSVHNWGEDPRGKWTIEVYISPESSSSWVGYVYEFTIKFHGTDQMPSHYQSPRRYSSFQTPDGLTHTM